MNGGFYRFILSVARVLVRILYPLRVSGANNIPPQGGAILCCNHISLLDPVLVALTTARPMRFMAKAELFKQRWFGKFLTMLGAFPVSRGDSDMAALRTSISILKNGEMLGIFAQGHRDKTGELAMESGVALLALRTGMPVIPLYIPGPYRAFRPFPIKIGPVVDLSAYGGKYNSERLKEATQDIERAVRALNTMSED